MPIIFIFPGQGAQYAGMGKDLYENFAPARDLYGKASDILGYDLADLSFNGPEEKLKQTEFTQPAVFVHSYACNLLARDKGLTPSAFAGHSLGEYTACAAAGVFTFEEGLGIVNKRAALMQKTALDNPGTMAAVIGLDKEGVDELCKNSMQYGVVVPANYNCPGQIVISGEKEGVEKACSAAKESGARKAVMLNVSGAFHSPLMKDGIAGLTEALDSVSLKDSDCPVYQNFSAAPSKDAAAIRSNLIDQLVGSVRFTESVSAFRNDGIDTAVELGPGKVVSAFIRRTDKEIKTYNISDTAGMDAALSAGLS
ncbi:MAG: ACP S-malonyltransferase [Fibrobacterota bacterium]